VAGLGLVLGAVVTRSEGLVALLLPAGAGVLGLMAACRFFGREVDPAEQQRLLWWTITAFLAHMTFGLIVSNVSTFAGYLGGDATTYHYYAVQILDHWTKGDPAPVLAAGKEGFYYLLAGLYRVFGTRMAAGIVVNAIAAAALVPLVSDTTRRAFGSKAARYVPALVVLLPGLFLWTSQLLKEAFVLLFIAIAANCAGRIVERVTVLPLVGLALAVALLFSFRGWVALMVLTGLLMGVTLGRQRLTAGIGTGAAMAALVTLLVLGVGLGSSGYNRAVSANLEQANTVRLDLATSAESGYGGDADISTPGRALSYLPVGVVALAFGPFPWQVSGLRQLPALADVAVWWCLLPSLWRGSRAARRVLGRRWLILVLPAATTSVLLALALGNFGTIVRERMQIVVLLVPLIAFGLAQRRQPDPAPADSGTRPVRAREAVAT
jgi:hypothetical protein